MMTEMDDTEQAFSQDHGGSMLSIESIKIEEYIGWSSVKHGLDHENLSGQWEMVLKSDSIATFFQTPLWCASWYQHYHDEYEPIIIMAKSEGRLVGIAPLAREQSSGRIVFAGASMSDYRDFVCEDGLRHEVIPLFLPRMVDIAPRGFVVLGHMQPESPTKDIVCRWASTQDSYNTIIRTHPCRRFRFESDEQLQELSKKKTIRQAFKFYRRSGTLQLRRIRDGGEWNLLKTTFFQQHCLRQAAAGRPVSFEDRRKQAFYSQLFESLSPDIHFSGLWFSNRPISFMFCLAYRGVLYYGAPSIDLLENKHSPGILHIIEAMVQCQKEGFREVDLTLGSSAFKERLANYSVELPTVYLYGRRSKFWTDSLRKWGTDHVRLIFEKLAGSPDQWYFLKGKVSLIRDNIHRLLHVPPVRILKFISNRLSTWIYASYTGEIFALTPDRLSKIPLAFSGTETVEFRCNRLEDLLLLEGTQRHQLTSMVQEAVKRICQGHELHTILLNGQLAHYGWSHYPSEPIYLPETRTPLSLPPGSLALYDFYTTEGHRGRRLYQANLFRIAFEAFSKGVTSVYITCEAKNLASQSAIQSVGFCRCAVHAAWTFFGMKWQRVDEELV